MQKLVAELVLFNGGSAALKLPSVTLEAIKPRVRTDIPELIQLRDGSGDDHGHRQKEKQENQAFVPLFLERSQEATNGWDREPDQNYEAIHANSQKPSAAKRNVTLPNHPRIALMPIS